MKPWIHACLAITLLVACGGKNNGGTPDAAGDPDAPGTGIDAAATDAPPFSGMCTAGGSQCSNCVDDDKDSLVDGFDPHCTGAADNDESSFATGIPGDNIDAIKQDCFFDGNSGAGDDGCDIHVCCLIGATTVAECPMELRKGFDPASCAAPLTDKCIATCDKLTPPGCDCFGCCNICDPVTNNCAYILLNPAISPDCTLDKINDPNACQSCTPNMMCGSPACGGEECILCPGQDPSDLPPSCNQALCPTDTPACSAEGMCAEGTYCANGCCIGVIF